MIEAQNLLARGDRHGAAQCLLPLMGLSERTTEQLFEVATLLMLCDWLPEAQTCAERALEQNADFPNLRWLYAGILSRRLGEGRHPELKTAYLSAHAADPDNPYLCIETADILRTFEEYAGARDLYALAVANSVEIVVKAEAEFKRGCVLLTLGETETAKYAFETVLTLQSDHEEARGMLETLFSEG